MKKGFLVAGFAMLSAGAFAQTNLQVFYDFGENRKMVTTTLEMFKSDDWGSTFFFVDYDYADKDARDVKNYGAQGSYFEIARGLNFWQDSNLGALSAHVEFNSGVGFGSRNWLFGAEYFMHSEDFSNTLTLELLYKTFCGNADSDLPIQLTAVWGMNNIFGVEGLNFSGFADFWGESVVNFMEGAQESADFVFISEPQLWYNVGKHFGCENLNLGAEVELSSNFAGYDGFKARPCLGLKWNF
jgi:hypothetical protein